MRSKLWPLALLFATTACSTAKPVGAPPADPRKPAQFTPTSIYSGGDGSSIEQAVVVLADSEDQGVDRENRWIFEHYGKFRKRGVGLATSGSTKYDVIKVELADHSEKEIFFDITSFFGKSGDK